MCLCPVASGCARNNAPDSKITKANADRITKGMTVEQVRDILGLPSESATTGQIKASSWKERGKVITIVFTDEKVTEVKTEGL